MSLLNAPNLLALYWIAYGTCVGVREARALAREMRRRQKVVRVLGRLKDVRIGPGPGPRIKDGRPATSAEVRGASARAPRIEA